MLKTFRTMAAAAVILLLGSSRAVRFFTLLVALLLASPTRADEPVPLKPGPGRDVVTLFCDTCHTLNYIRMNSVFLTPDAWKAEVTKMRTAFGAPVDDEAAKTITDYLAANYGVPPEAKK